MNGRRGVFIAIEGTDGSGKGTQFQLLQKNLVAAGYHVAAFDFPQYGQPSSYFVTQYLNGAYGDGGAVGPYTASLFYALDRYSVAGQIRQALDEGKVVLSNRFTGSSMAHQGTKVPRAEERRGFFIWLDNLEFELLHIPRPDISFVLRVPAAMAESLLEQKEPRAYANGKRDIHEADSEHLRRSVAVYDDLCQLFPKDFLRIDCVRDSQLLPIETVQDLMWQRVQPMLPEPPAALDQGSVVTPQNRKSEPAAPRVTAPLDSSPDQISDIDELAQEAFSNATKGVYAFTGKLSPATEAAGLDRALRTGEDIRSAVLGGLRSAGGGSDPSGTAAKLRRRSVVFEGGSDLLTRHLEAQAGADIVEPSAAYLYYDQKNKKGNYKYYTPRHLPTELAVQYHAHLNDIFGLYAEMVGLLTEYFAGQGQADARPAACQALRAVLPTATKSTVCLQATDGALDQLTICLLASELPEAQAAGQRLREEISTLRRGLPEATRAATPQAQAADLRRTQEQLTELAARHLPANHGAAAEAVRLVAASPRNEVDLVPDILYEQQDAPLETVQEHIQQWPYDRKLKALETYAAGKDGGLDTLGLARAVYSWELLSSYAVFSELQRTGLLAGAKPQPLTPRHGYETPQVIDEAGLSEQFEKCFDLSLKLYSLLRADFPVEAQYAVLQGHSLRWRFECGFDDLAALLRQPGLSIAARDLLGRMLTKLGEVHPVIGETLQNLARPETLDKPN